MTGRWARWSHSASGPGGMLFAPALTGQRETPASLIAQVQAAGEDAITLIDAPPAFRAAVAEAITVFEPGVNLPGGDGRMALIPEPDPWVLGPRLGSVRSTAPESFAPLTGEAAVRMRWLDAMLGPPLKVPRTIPRPLKNPPLSLCTQASRRISRHCLRFVLRSGGHTPRTVLRDGERLRGCLWDATLKGAFHLRFSVATTHLWARWDPAALEVGAEKRRAQRIRKLLPKTDSDTGDWLVFALLHRNLPNLGLTNSITEALRVRCLQLSSVLALAELTPLAPCAPLLEPRAVRLVECLDPYFIAGWRRQLAQITTGRVDAGLVHQVRARLAEWVELLDTRQRLDLARAVMIVLAGWADGFDASAVREAVARRGDRRFVRDRLAELAEIGVRLGELRQQMGAVRYGDERYAEAQLFLADYDLYFATRAERCSQIARILRRVIG